MKDDRRKAAEQRAVGDESNVAGKPYDAERNHGPHRERRDDESRRKKTDHRDVIHVPPKCLSPAKGSQRLPGRQRSFSIENRLAGLRARRKCQARAPKVSSPIGSCRAAACGPAPDPTTMKSYFYPACLLTSRASAARSIDDRELLRKRVGKHRYVR